MALAVSMPIVALGVGMSGQKLECASDRSYAAAPVGAAGTTPVVPAEAESIVNLRDLGFGTVSGICVGICERGL